MNKISFTKWLILLLIPSVFSMAGAAPIERSILNYLNSDRFGPEQPDQQCRYHEKYVVYLIDNFEQSVELVPEVTTTHGELLRRILKSGRDDIVVKTLNTSLTRGLAMVINDLRRGKCADAVISSIPGSNYTYRQINSLFSNADTIRPDTILDHREQLIGLIKTIAFNGFLSSAWLKQVDVNTSKLMNDARKVVFAEALGRFNIPLLIPYGNQDDTYLSDTRSVNILSILPNVSAYSALDQLGRRIAGFPYSPLSIGDEKAVYHIKELPDPDDPLLAHLDINDDGFADYTFRRRGKIPFRNQAGVIDFSPPLITKTQFEELKEKIRVNPAAAFKKELVLTASQYREIYQLGIPHHAPSIESGYIWLNSSFHQTPFHFEAVPWIRGVISGTSLIPPNKVKELLSMDREYLQSGRYSI